MGHRPRLPAVATRKTEFVSVGLTEPAREALRQLTLEWTSDAGRRISMSDVVLARVPTGRDHKDEAIARLTAEGPAPS